MWTQFWDMHSGGSCKESPYNKIYIEAPEDEARIIFFNRFGHNPERVTCTCCGEDYSISEEKSLAEITEFHRKEITRHRVYEETGRYVPLDDKTIKPVTVNEYKKQPNVLVISKSEIKPDERIGEAPEQGYVWV